MAIDLGGATSQARVGQMNPPPSEIPLVDVAPPTLKSVQKMNSFHRWIEREDLLTFSSLASFASVSNSGCIFDHILGSGSLSLLAKILEFSLQFFARSWDFSAYCRNASPCISELREATKFLDIQGRIIFQRFGTKTEWSCVFESFLKIFTLYWFRSRV